VSSFFEFGPITYTVDASSV